MQLKPSSIFLLCLGVAWMTAMLCTLEKKDQLPFTDMPAIDYVAYTELLNASTLFSIHVTDKAFLDIQNDSLFQTFLQGSIEDHVLMRIVIENDTVFTLTKDMNLIIPDNVEQLDIIKAFWCAGGGW